MRENVISECTLQVGERECYNNLGQDEDIFCVDTINKERVSIEYFTRVRKIWKSILWVFNKTITHNMFAVLVIKPRYCISDWTIQEIRNTDKQLSHK